MFGDLVKFGIRSAGVLTVIGIFIGILAIVTLPSPDYSFFSTVIGKGYALMNHWVPGFSAIWQIFVLVFGSWLAVQSARLAIYSSSIILKIFK